jgi:Holliday junction resolvasome RuvABC DNA-binding subunit
VTCLMRLEGVGEATARAIISVLGSDMDSITSILSGPAEQAMAALQRVPKIGPTKARALKHAWDAMGGEWSSAVGTAAVPSQVRVATHATLTCCSAVAAGCWANKWV